MERNTPNCEPPLADPPITVEPREAHLVYRNDGPAGRELCGLAVQLDGDKFEAIALNPAPRRVDSYADPNDAIMAVAMACRPTAVPGSEPAASFTPPPFPWPRPDSNGENISAEIHSESGACCSCGRQASGSTRYTLGLGDDDQRFSTRS